MLKELALKATLSKNTEQISKIILFKIINLMSKLKRIFDKECLKHETENGQLRHFLTNCFTYTKI